MIHNGSLALHVLIVWIIPSCPIVHKIRGSLAQRHQLALSEQESETGLAVWDSISVNSGCFSSRLVEETCCKEHLPSGSRVNLVVLQSEETG